MAEPWAQVFECFLRHGADPNALSERHQQLPGHPRLSSSIVVAKYFSDVLPEEAAPLRLLLIEKGAKSVECSGNGNRESVIMNHETTSKLKTIMSWFWL